MADDITNAINLTDRVAIAAIDFRSTRIYAIDSPDHSDPEHVRADDPKGRYHNVYHRHGNPNGTYEDDSDVYWRAIAEALRPAGAILLLGHGKGKSNASHHFVAYVEKHEPALAAKVIADVRADIGDLTDEQLLRVGQHYVGIDPLRDHGDSRRGA